MFKVFSSTYVEGGGGGEGEGGGGGEGKFQKFLNNSDSNPYLPFFFFFFFFLFFCYDNWGKFSVIMYLYFWIKSKKEQESTQTLVTTGLYIY